MENFFEQQAALLDTLKGESVDYWIGVEEALTEDRPGGELWKHRTVPWLQTIVLYMRLESGRALKFETLEEALCSSVFIQAVEEIVPRFEDGGVSTCRWRKFPELPAGRIKVACGESQDFRGTEVLGSIHLKIGDFPLSVKAGAVYEEGTEEFRISWLDECVLIGPYSRTEQESLFPVKRNPPGGRRNFLSTWNR